MSANSKSSDAKSDVKKAPQAEQKLDEEATVKTEQKIADRDDKSKIGEAAGDAKTTGENDRDQGAASSDRTASPPVACPSCKDPTWSCECYNFAYETENGARRMEELFDREIQQQLGRGDGTITIEFNILDLNKK
jgi:hypothetical protein